MTVAEQGLHLTTSRGGVDDKLPLSLRAWTRVHVRYSYLPDADADQQRAPPHREPPDLLVGGLHGLPVPPLPPVQVLLRRLELSQLRVDLAHVAPEAVSVALLCGGGATMRQAGRRPSLHGATGSAKPS